jgi:hypothetical protein
MKEKYITIIVSTIWGLGFAFMIKHLFQNGESIIIKIPANYEQNGKHEHFLLND